MNIWDWWNRARLRSKIAVSAAGLVALSAMMMAGFFFRYISQEIRVTEIRNASDMAVQVGNYFDEKLKGMFQRVYSLRSNNEFAPGSYLGKFLLDDAPYLHALALSQLSGVLSEIRMSDSFINSVYIYTPKGDFYDLARLRRPDFDFRQTAISGQIRGQSAFTALWCAEETDEIYADGRTVIPVVIPFLVEGYSQSCYIIIQLDASTIRAYLDSVYSDGGSGIVITGTARQEVISTGDHIRPALLEALPQGVQSDGVLSIRSGGDRFIVAGHSANVAPWRIYTIKSEKYLTRNLSRAAVFVLGITLASMLLCIVIALVLSAGITRPLRQLERTINRVTRRDFSAKFEYPYDNEVGQLGKSFNFMLDEISSLIARLNESIEALRLEKEHVREEQQLKRKAELRALQSQINPHFLYNTLSSIVWMADRIGAHDIGRISAKLGTLFKISLSKGKELISVGEETEHVSSYLSIQQLRYGGKLNYDIRMDTGLESLMTVKLILQPFVENAIYHGIKEAEGPGMITVAGGILPSGDDVEFVITDDGAGISPMQLQMINQRLAGGFSGDEEGYGIYNVNERIKLYFGQNYGVHFEFVTRGAQVRIRIPVIRKEELERYVDHDSSRR